MRGYRLAASAEARLLDIMLWTIDEFGVQQAERYESQLLSRCAEIASGRAVSRDLAALSNRAAAAGMRCTRAGSHHIVFIDDPAKGFVEVIDFVHVRMDLPGQLDALIRDF